jgi:hypothetical protein
MQIVRAIAAAAAARAPLATVESFRNRPLHAAVLRLANSTRFSTCQALRAK